MNINNTGSYPSGITASPTSSLGSNITVNTSADCVLSVLTFGTVYSTNEYQTQYGTL